MNDVNKFMIFFISITSTSLTVSLDEADSNNDRENQSFLVLYMVDPFSSECKLNNYPSIWSYIE